MASPRKGPLPSGGSWGFGRDRREDSRGVMGRRAPGSIRLITALYLPLAASTLIMSVEPPLINAGIVRTASAEVALAAFAVIYSIAALIESPVFMVIDAVVALATNRSALRLLQRFALLLGLVVTLLGMALAFTPLYDLTAGTLLGLPPSVAEAGRVPLQILLFWSTPVSWRRVCQGVLIRSGKSGLITLGTIIRLVAMASVLLAGLRLWPDRGAVAGSWALLAGVVVEALVVTGLASRSVAAMPAEREGTQSLTWPTLWRFYSPLVGTSLLTQITRPIVTAGIAALPLAQPSLAAWAVIWSLVSLISGAASPLQQTAVALASEPRSLQQVSRFSWGIGGGLSALLYLIACTPLGTPVLSGLFDLVPDLLDITLPALRVLIVWPLLVAIRGFLAGALIRRGKTGAVRSGMIVNVISTVVAVLAGMWTHWLSGPALAAVAVTGSYLVESGWLYWNARHTA